MYKVYTMTIGHLTLNLPRTLHKIIGLLELNKRVIVPTNNSRIAAMLEKYISLIKSKKRVMIESSTRGHDLSGAAQKLIISEFTVKLWETADVIIFITGNYNTIITPVSAHFDACIAIWDENFIHNESTISTLEYFSAPINLNCIKADEYLMLPEHLRCMPKSHEVIYIIAFNIDINALNNHNILNERALLSYQSEVLRPFYDAIKVAYSDLKIIV